MCVCVCVCVCLLIIYTFLKFIKIYNKITSKIKFVQSDNDLNVYSFLIKFQV